MATLGPGLVLLRQRAPPARPKLPREVHGTAAGKSLPAAGVLLPGHVAGTVTQGEFDACTARLDLQGSDSTGTPSGQERRDSI